MGSEYKECKLGDIANFTYGKMPKKHLLGSGDYITYSGYRYLEAYPEMNASSGDLIVVARGVGGTGDVKLVVRDCYLTNLSIKISLNNNFLMNEYFYYIFKGNNLKYLDSGSAQSQITISDLSNVNLKIPSIGYQKLVVTHLKRLDEKIVINNQINQTLEQMAQTLFKSWFVDFDPVIDNALDAGFFEQDLAFPEELLRRVEVRKVAREGCGFKSLPEDIRKLFPAAFEVCAEPSLGLDGWVPEGWKVSKLSDFGNIICGKTPSKQNKSFYDNDVSFIKIPDMHGNVFITKTLDNLSFRGSNSQIKKLLPENSICVSCIATVGLVSITTKPAHTNQQINSVIPQCEYFRDYLYFSLLSKKKYFHDLASGGSTTLNMNTTLFSNVFFINPDNFVLKRFQQESGVLLERIKQSLYEIDELAQLRDTLLPKLISGELPLSDINIDSVDGALA